MYKVIIVEDDKMVAAINRQYVEMNPAFRVAGMFYNGREGLKYLQTHPVDLVILDYYMPLMDGAEFLQQLKRMPQQPEVIMVTAASETETVRKLLGAGVQDYLVKPFEYMRFEQALLHFIEKQKLWGNSHETLSQEDVDRLRDTGRTSKEGGMQLQKGMQEHTLETIRRYMRAHCDCTFTSEEIAAEVKLSRVTVRRYLNYLTEIHEIASSVDYQTGGRPSIIYQYIKQ